MKTLKEQTITRTVVDTVTCNGCGKPINYEHEDLMDFTHTFGYGSTIFGDMTRIHFDLCEACIDELTKTFKIPHEETDEFYE